MVLTLEKNAFVRYNDTNNVNIVSFICAYSAGNLEDLE